MDPHISSKVEKLLANASIASVRSWLKANGKKFSAASRDQMVLRVAAQIEDHDLTFDELESAVIGIEEAGAKLIVLFEIDKDLSSATLKAHLTKSGIKLQANRALAARTPAKPKMIYAKLEGDLLRVKWSETHRKPQMDLENDTVSYKHVTKAIVLVADLKSKQAELRYDKPEQVHPHANPMSKSREAYFEHYVTQAETLLARKLKGSVLQAALKKLVDSKDLIRLHRDRHINQRNIRFGVSARGGDIREDEDWQAMHEQSGSTWAHDEESFYWRVDGAKGLLTREVFSHLNAIDSSLRVDSDCWDAEVEYAVKRVRELQ